MARRQAQCGAWSWTLSEALLTFGVAGAINAVMVSGRALRWMLTFVVLLSTAEIHAQPRPGTTPRLQVRVGVVAVRGELPVENATRMVRGQLAGFRECYETRLRIEPSLQGRVVLRFTFAPGGWLTVASALETSSGMAPVAECVVRAWRRANPRAGALVRPVSVSVPLLFSQG